jgi:hypothetical protein
MPPSHCPSLVRSCKRLGGKLSPSPRDLTAREQASRGPVAVSPPTKRRSRTVPTAEPSPRLPPLLAQRLRALVPASSRAGALLQPGVPASCPSLAAVAGHAALSDHRARPAAPPGAEPTVPPTLAASSRRNRQAGRADRASQAVRGPAPSRNSARFCGLPVRPAGLLPVVCRDAALAVAALLFARLPSGVTLRPPA